MEREIEFFIDSGLLGPVNIEGGRSQRSVGHQVKELFTDLNVFELASKKLGTVVKRSAQQSILKGRAHYKTLETFNSSGKEFVKARERLLKNKYFDQLCKNKTQVKKLSGLVNRQVKADVQISRLRSKQAKVRTRSERRDNKILAGGSIMSTLSELGRKVWRAIKAVGSYLKRWHVYVVVKITALYMLVCTAYDYYTGASWSTDADVMSGFGYNIGAGVYSGEALASGLCSLGRQGVHFFLHWLTGKPQYATMVEKDAIATAAEASAMGNSASCAAKSIGTATAMSAAGFFSGGVGAVYGIGYGIASVWGCYWIGSTSGSATQKSAANADASAIQDVVNNVLALIPWGSTAAGIIKALQGTQSMFSTMNASEEFYLHTKADAVNSIHNTVQSGFVQYSGKADEIGKIPKFNRTALLRPKQNRNKSKSKSKSKGKAMTRSRSRSRSKSKSNRRSLKRSKSKGRSKSRSKDNTKRQDLAQRKKKVNQYRTLMPPGSFLPH